MKISAEELNELQHYGVKRRSGRYPWGSGGHGYQRGESFRGMVARLRKDGLSDVDIAKGFGMKTGEFRRRITLERIAERSSDYNEAYRLREKGMSYTAIGKRMGKNESAIRSLLDPVLKERTDMIEMTANMIRDNIESKGYIDVGAGVENQLGISKTKLATAVQMLKDEGYKLHYVNVNQVGTGKDTLMKVMTKEDVPWKEVHDHPERIKLVNDYTEDSGRTWLGIEPPSNINSERIKIRYREDGGALKDGVIEIRPDVPDLDLGSARYAQVRIGVDGTHYMKGMAIRSEDVPDGYDVVYNTNKDRNTPSSKVFKTNENDPDNPFGSVIRQKKYYDADGNEKLSALNIVGTKPGSGEEGSWDTWSNTLSSQVLSKQRVSLAKQQLSIARDLRIDEFKELETITNPAVKKKLLKEFADGCDKAAEDLKAAALPRQSNHVLLPLNSMKETEVYAPNFIDGEPVVLIRHPHGGTFEIPELIVNNKNPQGRRILGNAKDAVAINPKVAAKLSGADFDGDTVLVIPNKSGSIKTSSTIKQLQEFEPRMAYKNKPGTEKMTEIRKQKEMGDVSNLITDMTIKGAKTEEIVRAVKHSMVVIDAVKHDLDYKQSYMDNGIADLKKKYQGKANAGASTIVSKAGSPFRVPEREELYTPDPVTGEKRYRETGATYIQTKKLPDGTRVPVLDRQGNPKVVTRMTVTTKMAVKKDAFELSSGTPMEAAYAEYANSMKDLANKARKTMVNTKNLVYSRSARETYAKEVATLKSNLNEALKNAPKERQAQLLANEIVKAKKEANPSILAKDLKKIKGQALIEARSRSGAGKKKIEISPREWEAIQAGAITNNTLVQILDNTDPKILKQKALPRTSTLLTPTKLVKARNMAALGHTQAEIASALGVSVSTLTKSLE